MNDTGARLTAELDLEALARGDRTAAGVLVDRCKSDRACVLEPDVFAALMVLSKTRSLAREWAALLAQLKGAHVDVPALKRALRAVGEVKDDDGDDDGGDDNKADTHVARLLEIAKQCEFYLDQYRSPHVSFQLDGRLETVRLENELLELFLVLEYCRLYDTPPSETALHSAMRKFRADARFSGVVNPIYVRVARLDDKILIDRATPDGSIYELRKTGPVINPKPGVRFSRPNGMLPMIEADLTATPIEALEALKSVTKFKEERDLVLTVSAMLDVLAGRGPHPVTEVTGPPGAAKTTFAMVMVKLTDPNVEELIAVPKTRRDHFINMNSRRLVFYNNVSWFSKDFSDTLCISGEGGWDTQRAHYTNASSSSLHARGPVGLTSVSSAVKEGDLGSRTLKIELAKIPADEQLSEAKFLAKFEAVAPTLLGGLLNALCEGLRRYDSIVEEDLNLPRLASFAMWSTACERAFDWPEGTLLRCFAETAAVAAESILSDSPIATVFLQFMEDRDDHWEGMASDLLKEMEALARRPLRVAEAALQMAKNAARDKDNHLAQTKLADAISDYKDAQAQLGASVNHKDWASLPNVLTRRLRSLDTQLRSAGITIRWPTSHKDGRKIFIEKKKKATSAGVSKWPSSPVDSSTPANKIMENSSSPRNRGDGDLPSAEGIGDDESGLDPGPADPGDLFFIEDEPDNPPPPTDRQNKPGLQKDKGRKGFEI